jgi:hypothetical protein
MLVAFVALVSLCVSTPTAQNAALGVAFARACAAEDARTHQNEPRLRLDRDEAHSADIHALVRPIGSVETVLRRERDAGGSDLHVDGAQVAAPFLVASLTATAVPAGDADPGVRSLPTDPPTRARARLMVFLN